MSTESTQNNLSTSTAVPDPRLDGVCRICLFRRDTLRPLAEQLNGVSLSHMLQQVAGTVFSVQEALPQVICSRCLAKLALAYAVAHEFRMQEELLRSYYGRGFLFEHLAEVQRNGHTLWYSEEVIRKLKSDQRSPGVFELVVDKGAEMVSGGSSKEATDLGYRNIFNNLQKEKSDRQQQICMETEPTNPNTNTNDSQTEQFEIIVKEEFDPNYDHSPDIQEEQLAGTSASQSTQSENTIETESISNDDPKSNDGTGENESTIHGTISKDLQNWMLSEDFKNVGKDGDSIPNCPLCDKAFTNRATYIAHAKRHRNKFEGKFRCDICSRTFVDKLYLIKHRKRHRNEPGYVEDDDLTVNPRRKYKTPPTPAVLECSQCGKMFTKKKTLQSHLLQHEHVKLGTFTCPFCGKISSTKWALSLHLKTHETPKARLNWSILKAEEKY